MPALKAAGTAAVSQNFSIEPASADRGRFASVLCGLAAAWIAAGSTGLLGHALRHALALSCLGAALVLGLRPELLRTGWRRLAGVALGVLGALILLGWRNPVANVMACALVLATLGWMRSGQAALPFTLGSVCIVLFGLYRFAATEVPWVWTAMDWMGRGLSGAVGWLVRQPLWTGATFAGLDFLALMLPLYLLWAGHQPSWTCRRVLWAGVAVGLAQVGYLTVLALVPKLLAAVPAATVQPVFGQRMGWDWARAVHTLVPWNLPALAGLLHLGVATYLMRTLPSPLPALARDDIGDRHRSSPAAFGWLLPARLGHRGLAVGVAVLALGLPWLTSLHPTKLSLEGKKIVLYEKGFLNWLKPKHGEYGRLSVGMYGMLPEFLRSYGAQCVVSPELSESDLAGAHVLMLIFPNRPWAAGQLERIWNFVRQGGSLIVLGEHTVLEKEGGNRFNDVLQPTAMRVAFDSAMFAVGGWLESYETLSHPATAGLGDRRNEFGVVIGASVKARWPARPVLVGRYGFADAGDPTNDERKGGSMMGNRQYDPGEKLGDQLLAAEQRFGRGRIMVFGDTSGFSNGILPGSHEFISRLFAALCADTWVSAGRLWAALIGLAGLVWGLMSWVGLFSTSRPWPVALAAVALAWSLTRATAISHQAAQVLPDGRRTTPNNLAYIDRTHLERCSNESWRPDGLGGLHLTLMRNGYLALDLHQFDPQRLDRAGVLISVAPARSFSAAEIVAVRRFIEQGGIFICTVGWPESAGSRSLLAALGFYVGGIGAATTGEPEPKPFGHFKAPFFNGGDYMAYVRFHAGWNVESIDPHAQPLAYGPRNPKGLPGQEDPTVILMRRIGRGKAVVVADTAFATNQNLEHEGGEPFEGLRENADFWRWLISYLTDQPLWTPPKPVPVPASPATQPNAVEPGAG